MTFPGTLAVEKLNAKSEDFAENLPWMEKIRLLDEGGPCFEKSLDRFLKRRPSEPNEMYQLRREMASYTNIVGTANGWYLSKLFEEDPVIDQVSANNKPLTPDATDFFAQFIANCDRAGTSLVNFTKQIAMDLLLYRRAWVLVDLPNLDTVPLTKADQEQAGALSPYLVRYDPRTVVRWGNDAHGSLSWAVIATEAEVPSGEFPHDEQCVYEWRYFNRDEFAYYRAVEVNDEEPREATLADTGPHALAQIGKIPLLRIELPESLWLSRRAFWASVKHLNLENALDWALFINALAILVITGRIDEIPTLSELGMLQLPQGSAAAYLEQSGAMIAALQSRVTELREEAYRLFYLVHQGRDPSAVASAQSGVSKEQDMMPSQDVIGGIGAILRAAMQELLDMAATIRQDERKFSVRWPCVEGDDSAIGAISRLEKAKMAEIPSDTLIKELERDAAAELLAGKGQDVKDLVDNEIKAGPTQTQRAIQARADQLKSFTSSFQAAA